MTVLEKSPKKQTLTCPICNSTFFDIFPAGECNGCFRTVCGHCLQHDIPDHHDSRCQECLEMMTPHGRLKHMEKNELIAILEDPSSEECHLVARQLGELGEKTALDPLCRAVKSNRLDLRREAAAALGKLGNTKAVPDLLTALNDTAPAVRSQAALALAELGEKKAVAPIKKQLNDPSLQAAGNAVRALGKLLGQDAIHLLEGLTQDHKVAFIRCEALTILAGLDFGVALRAALACLNDSKKEVILTACKTLGRLKDTAAVPALEKMAEKGASASIRVTASLTLKTILENEENNSQ